MIQPSPIGDEAHVPSQCHATMPVTYEFDDCTVILRMIGIYEPSEIHRALTAAVADPACPEIVGMLFDVRESRSLAGRTADEVRAMARFLGSQADRFGRRIAIVADSDATFGLMRLGSVGVEQLGVNASVFRCAVDASAWLRHAAGLPNASTRAQPHR
jgi:hypothetical protein